MRLALDAELMPVSDLQPVVGSGCDCWFMAPLSHCKLLSSGQADHMLGTWCRRHDSCLSVAYGGHHKICRSRGTRDAGSSYPWHCQASVYRHVLAASLAFFFCFIPTISCSMRRSSVSRATRNWHFRTNPYESAYQRLSL